MKNAVICVCFLGLFFGMAHSNSAAVLAPEKQYTAGLFRKRQSFDGYCAHYYRYSLLVPRNFFAFGGLQEGDMRTANAGFGLMFMKNNFMLVNYHLGKEEYSGEFLDPFCRDCQYLFHGMWLGAGREFTLAKRYMSELYISPICMLGIEFINGRGLIADHDTRLIYNPVVRPQLNLGYKYKYFDVFVGVNQPFWLPHARTMEGRKLVGALDGNPLLWDRDLFSGRKGPGVLMGIRFFVL